MTFLPFGAYDNCMWAFKITSVARLDLMGLSTKKIFYPTTLYSCKCFDPMATTNNHIRWDYIKECAHESLKQNNHIKIGEWCMSQFYESTKRAFTMIHQ